MSITLDQVEKLFNYLKTDSSQFFEHVADNVN
jgi:hypothetical protein